MGKLLVLLTIFFVIGICNANAQTEKGTFMLGGGFSFQAADNATIFLINPNAGLFVKNNLAFGAHFNLLFADDYTQWSIGPFGRYYFGKNEKGKIFGQAAITIEGASNSDVSLGGGLAGGYAFFLNQSIAFEIAASYYRFDDSGLFVLGAGFQIHFRKQK